MVGDSNLSGFDASQIDRERRSVGARAKRWLTTLVLSDSPKQRVVLIRSLTAMLVYVVALLMLQYSAANGLIKDVYWVHWLQICIMVWMVAIYTFLRSGLNWLLSDPGLTQFQIFGANTWIILSYALCPPVRGGIIIIVALVLVFGIFEQTRRGQVAGNIWTLTLFGIVQWYMSQKYPDDFPARIEIFHWAMLATVVPTVSLLGGQINTLRVRLQVQRGELLDAMDRIRDMAQRDELTGLCNRRYMNELLVSTLRRMERSTKSVSVCLIDIDFFKKVNDTHGHSVGDEVLRSFSALVIPKLRPSDTMARWGGEEFLLLMYDTRGDQALASVERLRESVCEMVIASTPGLRITFSAGIAQFLPFERIDTAIERADHALYQAKQHGRNQTVLAYAPDTFTL
jgi:diguanylate cyclase (GGDEF)-like protein